MKNVIDTAVRDAVVEAQAKGEAIDEARCIEIGEAKILELLKQGLS